MNEGPGWETTYSNWHLHYFGALEFPAEFTQQHTFDHKLKLQLNKSLYSV